MRFTPVASSNAAGADSIAEPQEPLSLILQVASTRLPRPAVFLSAVTNSRGWILRKPRICITLQRRSRGALTAARSSIVADNQRGTSQARALPMKLARRESIEWRSAPYRMFSVRHSHREDRPRRPPDLGGHCFGRSRTAFVD